MPRLFRLARKLISPRSEPGKSGIREQGVNKNCKITITSKFDDDLSVRNELLRRLRWKFVYEVWRL